ncbi:helix-turn-helix transcriptional regulator [Gordonia sp. N1V]|uniref:helix-turn-helix domain-containing protein n=1 Tax=Gordonia sp. N1V TaxID=3034163 RepID=UPI0023E1FCBA|nr:helix-turn-helix transcriptional regulator [Gordonia sp. N1V]
MKVLATLRLNQPGLSKIRRLTGLDKDYAFAERIRVDSGTVSRVLTGKSAPGPRFIAGCIEAFGSDCFTDLFDVIPDDTAA